MRLIDADKLAERVENLEAVALEQVLKYEPSEEHEKWKVWSAILNERTAFKYDLFDAPTVDAEPVVRCKDCAYWGTKVVYANGERADCLNFNFVTPCEFFCKWGERREDGKTD